VISVLATATGSSTPTPTSSSTTGSLGLGSGVIAGIAVGGAIVVGLLVMLVPRLLRYLRNQPRSEFIPGPQPAGFPSPPGPPYPSQPPYLSPHLQPTQTVYANSATHGSGGQLNDMVRPPGSFISGEGDDRQTYAPPRSIHTWRESVSPPSENPNEDLRTEPPPAYELSEYRRRNTSTPRSAW
jgi:hypothetical protein